MSTTNENILKSLAVLEQNLKDINSAKEQVNNVVETSEQLTSVINAYKDSLEGISKNVAKVLISSKDLNLETRSNLIEQVNRFESEISRIENFDLESNFEKILTTLTNQLDKQNIELSKKYEEGISKSDNIVLRLDQQDKETKSMKKLLFLTIGIVIIGIIITFVMK